MEHFILPKGKLHLRIPNLTFDTYTRSDVDWNDYPASKGWKQEDLDGEAKFGGRQPADVQSFFQSWLYFGTAIEVLAIAGIDIQQSDFLDDTGSFVSTRKLPMIFREWEQKVKETKVQKDGDGKISSQAYKTALILKRVYDFAEIHCIPRNSTIQNLIKLEDPDRSTISPVTELTWISILALGHSLMLAMTRLYDIKRTGSQWAASKLLKAQLINDGWCPADVERATRDLNIDGHYYLASMKVSEGNITHQNCTFQSCNARNVDAATYQQIHVGGPGDCDGEVMVDTSTVIKIISDGMVPVFQWDSKTRELKATAASMLKKGRSNPAYVALSHVDSHDNSWSDGLGNPKENAVLKCQVDEIQKHVDSLAAWEGINGQPKHFWLDTLCIPVGNSMERRTARRKAISMMANIYSAASAVLILSSSFKSFSIDSPLIERHVAYYLSNWNRRLWTVQEGMLARRIFILFADNQLCDFDDNRMKSRLGVSRARGALTSFGADALSQSMGNFMSLRDFLRGRKSLSAESPNHVRYSYLNVMLRQINTRSTSRKSDETICTATILGVNTMRLLTVEQEMREELKLKDGESVPDADLAKQRMKVFFSTLKMCNFGMIFSPEKRIEEDGFRWAPISFLGIPKQGWPRASDNPGVIDQHGRGLFVRGGGVTFKIDGSSARDHKTNLLVTIPQDGKESVKLQIRAYQATDATKLFLWEPEKEYGLIFENSLEEAAEDINDLKTRRDINFGAIRAMLEVWLEGAFGGTNVESPAFSAVVGEVITRSNPTNETEWIQIRHSCLAGVSIANPKAILHLENESNSDGTGSDIPEDDPALDGPILDEEGGDGSDEWSDEESEGESTSDDLPTIDFVNGRMTLRYGPEGGQGPVVEYGPGDKPDSNSGSWESSSGSSVVDTDSDGAFDADYLDLESTNDFVLADLVSSEEEPDGSSSESEAEEDIKDGPESEDEEENFVYSSDGPSHWDSLVAEGGRLPNFTTCGGQILEATVVKATGAYLGRESRWYIL
ncbi:hypothetical protein ABW20_dc0100680 [Dactylellina cionopaga]|nr:hypothetical protein ABW20_dc0100680 [Dactylellina cionopaga]